MKQALSLFDLDGTITNRDTLWEIIRFQKGTWIFVLGMILLSPVLVAYKLGIISNTSAKQSVLRLFFAGMSEPVFQAGCNAFQSQRLPSLVRRGAGQAIREALSRGDRVIVVSASAGNWVSGWCRETGVECIATILESIGGRMTGRILGKNCAGTEKVIRIRETVQLEDYDPIYAYGDSPSDQPLLGLATYAFYKPFREKEKGDQRIS
ncbi:MAG TPA: HAD family hydrolase [Chitinophagaceae bacterium]|nr:HAD family hydrolase [Chitinophagaceae bacterium]